MPEEPVVEFATLIPVADDWLAKFAVVAFGVAEDVVNGS